MMTKFTAMKELMDHSNGEYTLTIGGETASVHGALFDSINHTIKFDRGELVYNAGIGGEIRCITDYYTEVTDSFEANYGDKYQFHGDEDHNNKWFHKDDFWEHTWDSSSNLYHYIRYAATHRSEENRDANVDMGDVWYPFPERQVISFFDPQEERVRVFGSQNEEAMDAVTLACALFQPKMTVYASTEDTRYGIVISATPTPGNDNLEYKLSELSVEYVLTLKVCVLENGRIVQKPITELDNNNNAIKGDLWDIVHAISNSDEPWIYSTIEPYSPDRFLPRKLFI